LYAAHHSAMVDEQQVRTFHTFYYMIWRNITIVTWDVVALK